MRLIRNCGLACLLLLPVVARSAPAEVFDRWLTQNHDGVIEITRCEAGLCGRIVGMDAPRRPDGGIPRDPDGRPQCGLQILEARPADDGGWAGTITDPSNGSRWNVTLRVDARGRLRLRGYVLAPLLGSTRIWTRYAGAVGRDCTMR